jgi:hypothetical protein
MGLQAQIILHKFKNNDLKPFYYVVVADRDENPKNWKIWNGVINDYSNKNEKSKIDQAIGSGIAGYYTKDERYTNESINKAREASDAILRNSDFSYNSDGYGRQIDLSDCDILCVNFHAISNCELDPNRCNAIFVPPEAGLYTYRSVNVRQGDAYVYDEYYNMKVSDLVNGRRYPVIFGAGEIGCDLKVAIVSEFTIIASGISGNAPIQQAFDNNVNNVGGGPLPSTSGTSTAESSPLPSGLAVTSDFNVFVRGLDNQIWYRNWGEWVPLGGEVNSAPAAISWGPNRIDLFARGLDNVLWHKIWDGTSWTDWESLGGEVNSAPAVTSWGPNRLDVFAQGLDNVLWHKIWDGTSWTDWESLGGEVSSAPAAVSWGPNRIDLFARGLDNVLWHKIWDGISWTDWESLGGEVNSASAVTSWGPNRLDVFAQGLDNVLWHKVWDGTSWTDWESLGGEVSSAPAAISLGPNRIVVFARGLDNQPWYKVWDGANWTDWTLIGGEIN